MDSGPEPGHRDLIGEVSGRGGSDGNGPLSQTDADNAVKQAAKQVLTALTSATP